MSSLTAQNIYSNVCNSTLLFFHFFRIEVFQCVT